MLRNTGETSPSRDIIDTCIVLTVRTGTGSRLDRWGRRVTGDEPAIAESIVALNKRNCQHWVVNDRFRNGRPD